MRYTKTTGTHGYYAGPSDGIDPYQKRGPCLVDFADEKAFHIRITW